MSAAQIAAVDRVVRPRTITPVHSVRRGNNPPKKAPSGVRQPDPKPVQASGTTTGNPLTLELQKVKAELIELKKTTNQQLLTEVKFLRGAKTALEAKVLAQTTFLKDLQSWDKQVKANGGIGLADHMCQALDKTTV